MNILYADDRPVLAVDDTIGDGVALARGLAEVTTDEALDRGDGVLRIRDGLVLRGTADDALARPAERHDRGRGPVSLGVDDDGGLAALHDSHRRIRGAEVNTQNLSHDVLLSIQKHEIIFAFPFHKISVPYYKVFLYGSK